MFFSKKKKIKTDAQRSSYNSDELDIKFYKNAYPDLTSLTDQQAIAHWEKNGKKENRIGKIDDEHIEFDGVFYREYYQDVKDGYKTPESAYIHFIKHGADEGRDISVFQTLDKLNIPHALLPKEFSYQRAVENNKINNITFDMKSLVQTLNAEVSFPFNIFADKNINACFYYAIAKFHLKNKRPIEAKNALISSIAFCRKAQAIELLANIALDDQHYHEAIALYSEILSSNQASKWCYLNLAKAQMQELETENAINTILTGIKKHPDFSSLPDYFKSIEHKIWNRLEQKSRAIILLSGNRDELINQTKIFCSYIYNMYYSYYTLFSDSPAKTHNNPDRVLIVGDFHVPQCIRYRIDQKKEQMEYAGIEVETLSWTELDKNQHLFARFDTIIFYRVPALPTILKYMALANALGKMTFYEIDDLLFDQAYPHPIETYGGYVDANTYNQLLTGMPLFRTAAQYCLYGIASTKPLCDKLAPLVIKKECYLHRNGLDDKNLILDISEKEFQKKTTTIFYGSGTQAHNSDFIEIVLPAIETIFSENDNVRLVIMGYLSLPGEFLSKYKNKITEIAHTKDLLFYQSVLSAADINLAVLISDIITDCKSELKWTEAAMVGVPSVVSNTKNYLDVIQNGVDGFIANDSEEYYKYLSILINDSEKRLNMAKTAQHRVLQEYSVENLSTNIKDIIQHATSTAQSGF